MRKISPLVALLLGLFIVCCESSSDQTQDASLTDSQVISETSVTDSGTLDACALPETSTEASTITDAASIPTDAIADVAADVSTFHAQPAKSVMVASPAKSK